MLEGLHDGFDACVLLRQFPKLVLVGDDVRVGEQSGDFFETIADGLELEADGLFHCSQSSRPNSLRADSIIFSSDASPALRKATLGLCNIFFISACGGKLDGIFGRLTFGHAFARLLGNLLAKCLMLFAQCRDDRCDLFGSLDGGIAADLIVQESMRLDGGGFAISLALQDDLVEIVDRI